MYTGTALMSLGIIDMEGLVPRGVPRVLCPLSGGALVWKSIRKSNKMSSTCVRKKTTFHRCCSSGPCSLYSVFIFITDKFMKYINFSHQSLPYKELMSKQHRQLPPPPKKKLMEVPWNRRGIILPCPVSFVSYLPSILCNRRCIILPSPVYCDQLSGSFFDYGWKLVSVGRTVNDL